MQERCKIKKSADGTRIFVLYQPGNGTRYEAYGVRVSDLNEDSSWIVSFPQFGTTYGFHVGCTADPGYIAEKLGNFRSGSKGTYQSSDIHEMCKVIAMIVPQASHHAATDDSGHFPISALEPRAT